MTMTSSVTGVQQRIEQIRDFVAENDSTLRKGRQLNWELLGRIYVNGREIEADPGERDQLNRYVDSLPEMEKHRGWISSQKTVFECLLVAALGYDETLAKRHYYGRACENAQEATIPATVEAFTEWVKGKGGIIGAGKGKLGPHESADVVIKRFVEKRQADAAETEPSGEVIQLAFTPAEGSSNLSAQLVEHLPDGQSRVIGGTSRPAIVASLIKEVEGEPSPAKLARIEKLARWHLNRATALIVGAWRGKPGPEDFERFLEAVQDLQAHQSLAEKYFDGVPKAELSDDKTELKEQNLDAAMLDPARYIANAKINTLPPVDVRGVRFKATDTKKKRRDVVEALPGYKEWRANQPRRR